MGGVSFCCRLGDPVPYIFQYGKVFFRIVFSRLSLCSPHLSLPLRGGMIMLYPLVGGGATSRSSRLG